MNARRLVLCLLVALVPLRSMAQIDDLLTPLAPEEKKVGKKSAPKAKKKKAISKKKQRASKQAEQEEAFDPLLAPLVPSKAEVLVRVSGPQDGAQVLVDGKEVKPGQKMEVDAGEHTVVVKRVGWADFSKKVKVKPGESAQVTAMMDAVAGVLTVTADVPGSTVLLDGRELGEAPISGELVEPGSHVVVVRREGFEDSVSNISVRAGRDYTVKGNLRPQERTRTLVASSGDRPEATQLVPEDTASQGSYGLGEEQTVSSASPWYQRWYVWAGVGAVAAAAVTTAVVASNNGGGAPLSPTDVCGGPCDDVINPPAGALRF